MTKYTIDSVGNKKPAEPELNDWGHPVVLTHDNKTIQDLSARVDQLEHNLERTNEQLLELAQNCDALVKLVKQVATR